MRLRRRTPAERLMDATAKVMERDLRAYGTRITRTDVIAGRRPALVGWEATSDGRLTVHLEFHP